MASSPRTLASWLPDLLGPALAGALLCGVAVSAGAGFALLLVLSAVGLCVLTPWRSAGTEALSGAALRGGAASVAWVLGAGGVALLALPESRAYVPAAAGYLLLGALSLLCLSLAARALPRPWRAGAGALLSLGALGLLFLPYGARVLFAPLSDAQALEGVLRAPLAALCGTFGGVDLLRQGSLYHAFPLAQSYPYAYPAPGSALLDAAGLALLSALVLGATRLPQARLTSGARAVPSLVPAAVVLLGVLFGAPEQAEAQLFPEASQPTAPVGDMETRVTLGYYLPELSGRFALDNVVTKEPGTDYSFRRTLDLDPEFVVPTFELQLGWANAGRIFVQYLESVWRGDNQLRIDTNFEIQTFRANTILETRQRIRTIAVGGALALPVADFLSLSLITTQRYIKYETKLRGFEANGPGAAVARNSMEVFMPTLGLGADVFLWNIVSVYGNIQWLDFSTDLVGTLDRRWDFQYHEWRLGIRLELVKHAHMSVEYYFLETRARDSKDGIQEEYSSRLEGLRLQVAVLF